MAQNCFLGIDFGTSGARAIAIDEFHQIQAMFRCRYDKPVQELARSYSGEKFKGQSLAQTWQAALFDVIDGIDVAVRRNLRAIAIDGTSATVLWCDLDGKPVTEPILYNDDRGQSVMDMVQAIAPPDHVVCNPTSSLAKLLWWTCQSRAEGPDTLVTLQKTGQIYSGYFMHQADWLAFLLHGKLGISDYHNSLKLGYDPETLAYPSWMQRIQTKLILPTVISPGTPIGIVLKNVAKQLELPLDCYVCAGTTDSIAAFLASGGQEPGDAVTSLGSTLVIKLLSRHKIVNTQFGVYSHRLDQRDSTQWLVGGASNTGGAVLRHFFSNDVLKDLSSKIDPTNESPLDYYPLSKPGERFPICDRHFLPRLTPRPDNDVEFLHGLLESMARIEAQGFKLLSDLGATDLNRVYTSGGGAENPTWTAIRHRHLGVPVEPAPFTEAAYGTAKLAYDGFHRDTASI